MIIIIIIYNINRSTDSGEGGGYERERKTTEDGREGEKCKETDEESWEGRKEREESQSKKNQNFRCKANGNPPPLPVLPCIWQISCWLRNCSSNWMALLVNRREGNMLIEYSVLFSITPWPAVVAHWTIPLSNLQWSVFTLFRYSSLFYVDHMTLVFTSAFCLFSNVYPTKDDQSSVIRSTVWK